MSTAVEYVSFSQVHGVFLADLSISTVRTRGKALGITITQCNHSQLQLLRTTGAVHDHTSRAAMFSVADAQRLVLSFSRDFYRQYLVCVSDTSGQLAVESQSVATANLSTAQQNTERQTSTTPVGESQSLAMSDAAHLLHRSNEGTIQPPTTDVPTPTVEESCSRPLEQKRVPSGEQDPSSRGEALPCHPGKRVKYALPSLPECTKKQIEAMRLYYTSEFNLKRTGECLSQGTFAKLRERVLCFLGFTAREGLEPRLTQYNDESILEKYHNYLRDGRQLASGTIGCHVQAAINVLKFLHQDSSAGNYQGVPIILQLRAQVSHLCRMAGVERRTRKGSLTQDSAIFWSEVLEVLRRLLENYNSQPSCTWEQYKLHQMIVTLLLYSCLPPGRSACYRLLKVVTTDVNKAIRDEPCSNFLVITDDRLWLSLGNFKTAKTLGRRELDIQQYEFLAFHIKTFVERTRPRLLMGNQHPYLLVNSKGEQFSSSSYSAYIQSIFVSQGLNKRISTNALRHAFCTWILEREDALSDQMLQAIARACGHSTRAQRLHYDDRTHQQVVRKAVDFVNKTTMQSICQGEVLDDNIAGSQDDFQVPDIGQIVAMVAGDSKPRDPKIILAKVLSYKQDEAQLHYMEKIEGTNNLYRPSIGTNSVWHESVKTLIWPIFVTFDSDSRGYRLHNTAKEIADEAK